MVAVALGTTSQAGAVPQDKVTFCHETGSATNPYVEVTAAAAGVANGHYNDENGNNHGEIDITPGDIIPAFEYQQGQGTPQQFHGQNLDAVVDGVTGQQILDNGCAIPSAPASSAPPTTPTCTANCESSCTENCSTPTTHTHTHTLPPVHHSSVVVQQQSGAAVGAGQVQSPAQGPIPAGASAGLHLPTPNATLRTWGIVLMLLGGLTGLSVGLWPTRRRAH